MDESLQRRRYFRIRYPLTARPKVVLEGLEIAVTELSEEGLRVLLEELPKPCLTMEVDAMVGLRGGQHRTRAKYLRTVEDEAVLTLAPPVPQTLIMAEQRWLVGRYPKGTAQTDMGEA